MSATYPGRLPFPALRVVTQLPFLLGGHNLELQRLHFPNGEDAKHPLARLPVLTRESGSPAGTLAVPPPKADLSVSQLGLSEHGIQVLSGHLGPILLHLPKIECDGAPRPGKAGDLEHLAVLKKQLGQPRLHCRLTIKEKSETLQNWRYRS